MEPAEAGARKLQEKICCGLIPRYYIKKGHESMACFALPSHLWKI